MQKINQAMLAANDQVYRVTKALNEMRISSQF